jgi:hypothetical protein
MNTPVPKLAIAALLLLLFAAPAFAGEPGSAALFGSYWNDFLEHWGGVMQQQNGIVMGVLGVGVLALFIITRGKWRKT